MFSHVFMCDLCVVERPFEEVDPAVVARLNRCSNCKRPGHTIATCKWVCGACDGDHVVSECPVKKSVTATKVKTRNAEDKAASKKLRRRRGVTTTREALALRLVFCCGDCGMWVSDPCKRGRHKGLSRCSRCKHHGVPLPEHDPRAHVLRVEWLIANKTLVMLSHDECTCNSNDTQGAAWITVDGKSSRVEKSRGAGLMLSAFITQCGKDGSPGVLHYKIVDPRTDGYWTLEDMLLHVKEAIAEAEKRFPGCALVFLFDHSSNHRGMDDDCLNLNKLNKSPGSKVKRVTRDTAVSGKRESTMVPATDADGKETGGLMTPGLLHLAQKRCPELKKLKPSDVTMEQLKTIAQGDPRFADWQHSMTALEEVVERAGHIAMFLPKFHCECNHIEYMWASLKNPLRKAVDGTVKTMRVFIEAFLTNVRVSDVKGLWRRSLAYITEYGKGATGVEADAVVAARRDTSRAAKRAQAKVDAAELVTVLKTSHLRPRAGKEALMAGCGAGGSV